MNKEERDILYETDITYKVLVDNYCKASIKYAKNMNNDTSKELSISLNALSKYKSQIRNNNLLFMFKEINFTNEDFVEMFNNNVIPTKILLKMIEFKVGDSDE